MNDNKGTTAPSRDPRYQDKSILSKAGKRINSDDDDDEYTPKGKKKTGRVERFKSFFSKKPARKEKHVSKAPSLTKMNSLTDINKESNKQKMSLIWKEFSRSCEHILEDDSESSEDPYDKIKDIAKGDDLVSESAAKENLYTELCYVDTKTKTQVLQTYQEPATRSSQRISPQLKKLRSEDNWTSCIGNEDVLKAKELLQTGVLPNTEELDKMCQTSKFWREKDVNIQACTQVCKYIQRKFGKLVEDVWPGVPATKPRNDESVLCTFIIVSNEDIDLKEIKYRYIKIPSKRYVGSSDEIKDHTPLSPRQLNELKQVETVIHKHGQNLMEKHKFLTMISASQYRCSGQAPNVRKTDGLCIVLWVQYKGYVPIDEEPFQETYGGVAVDVREGSFHIFSGGADKYQDFLKMGCKISGESEGNRTPAGTLGGFIEHPKYGYCGVTSAHCVLPPAEMKRLSSKNEELNAEYPSFLHTNDDKIAYCGNVYQPDQSGGKVGSLVKAVCHKGNGQTNNVGLDLAVFQICDRFPKSAEFPIDKNGDTLNYISGKTVGFPRPIANEEELIKFGVTTGLTRGKLESEIAILSVRQDLNWTYGSSQSNIRIHLNNQLEVNSIKEQPFATCGDSGALVFSHGNNGQGMLCVGMVVGGKCNKTENKVSYVITPITAILKELDITGFKNFESGKLQADIEEIRADVKVTRTDVKETRAELKEASAEVKETGAEVRAIKEILTRRWVCAIS